MTTIKKKIISVVALLCAVMLLIGILPTSVFRNNNASAADDIKTIYFDTYRNSEHSDYDSGEWSTNDSMYIYLYTDTDNSGIQPMTKETNINSQGTGFVWSYTPTKNYSYVLFLKSSSWPTRKQSRTIDINLDLYSTLKKPCFYLNGYQSSSPWSRTVGAYDLQTSIANSPINFYDMTGTLTGDITAVFSGDGITDIPLTVASGGSVTVPNDSNGTPYTTVEFKNGDTTLGTYNLFGEGENSITYDENTCNTFFYGATEKADNTKISYWGALPTSSSTITSQKLYLDDSIFPTSGTAPTIQFNSTSGAFTIGQDGGTAETAYSYNISSISTNDIITVTYSGTKYHFMWSDIDNNMLTVSSDIATVSSVYGNSNTIYFDATLSKLSYAYTVDNSASMPSYNNDKIYVQLKNSSTNATTTKQMEIATKTIGSNTWNDVYKIDLSDDDFTTYDKIIFYSTSDGSWVNETTSKASRTVELDLPKNTNKTCFYADSSDECIYNNSYRSGYWGKPYTIRDAETGKTGKDVVEIDQPSEFKKDSNKFYVNSTFYDYYTDYELNGNNRKNYTGSNGVSQRNWVNFRQFDQALSDYYSDNDVGYNNAIYTGQFQPAQYSDSLNFANIAGTLNLYGWFDPTTSQQDYMVFISNNNSGYSTSDYNDGEKYLYATQNIVANELKDGLPTSYIAQEETTKTPTILPYFNEDFLLGNNSKNTKIGEVYHNVAFPFEKQDVGGVDYWVFDSSKTTLAMKENKDTGEYMLKDVGNQDWAKNLVSNGTTSSTTDNPSTTYGFFPFNEKTTGASGVNYNYGFGTKLEFKFRLTDDGTVLNSSNNKVPIEFQFSGDDDVWVFIDNQLVLDVGGDHGTVTGTINFQTLESKVSAVKQSANNTVEGSYGENVPTLIGVTNDRETTATNVLNNKTDADGNPIDGNNMSQEHTLTMFYMERGMWESNMKVQFNFPDENQLEVEKEVDTTDVNDMFKSMFDNKSIFTFNIQNLATHYGSKEVSGETITPVTFATEFNGTISAADSSKTTVKKEDSKGSQNNVLFYQTTGANTNKQYTEQRIATFNADGNATKDISKMEYLTFKMYVEASYNVPNTSIYIRLTDSSGKKINGYLGADKIYGSLSGTSNTWHTAKVMFKKLTVEDGFDYEHVVSISVENTDGIKIWYDDFIFEPSASEGATLTGFVTKQYDIPDYNSATSGKLEPANGATYTSSISKAKAVNKVDSDGNFVLQNNETALFRDQFRRGSYISLTEDLTDKQKELFKTSYTVYENDEAVTSFGTGSSKVTNGSISSLNNIVCNDTNGYTVNDDRTEQKITATDSEGIDPSQGNSYNGQQPQNAETFVFRSYSDPDNENTTTKLKVVYTNKVNTNSLTIRKEQAQDSASLEDKKFTFYVEFYNVGGMSLESSTQVVGPISLGVNEQETITGIPVGTDYTIYEIKGEDSVLNSVTKNGSADTFVNDTYNSQDAYSVNGTIPDTENTTTSYTFNNYKKEVVSFELTKQWQKSDGTEMTDNLPTSIYVKLQRSTDGNTWSDVDIVKVEPGYESWSTFKYTFKDLDKYQNNDTSKPYSYQVVEVNSDDTALTDNKITLNGTEYTVSYGEVTNSGSVYSQIITNKAQPTHSLTVYKVDGADTSHSLSGAEFTLKQGDTFVPITKVSDGIYKYDTSSTTVYNLVTDSYGSFTVTGLPNGTYTLTETQAPSGYLMNSNEYTITFGVDENGTGTGSCKINGAEASDYVFYYSNYNNTAELTVSNRQIVLPGTGGTGSGVNIVFIGIVFVIIAGAGFVLVNRKAFCRKKN